MIQNFKEGYSEMSVDAQVMHSTDTKELESRWGFVAVVVCF